MTAPPATRLREGEFFTRSFEPLLELRSPAKGGDGRTIDGIAVPYLRRQRIDENLVEQFHPGAFDHQIREGRPTHPVFFTRDHLAHGGRVIGKALELRNDSRGLWGAFRVSATAEGDETLALVGDGVLSQLSVGFRAAPGGDFIEPDGTVTRTRADLREVSIVLAGAYGEAAEILAVRAEAEGTLWRPAPRRVDQAAELLAGFAALPALPD